MKGKPMNVLESLTDRSRKLFLDLAEDASNWSGVLEDAMNGLVRRLQNATALLQYAQKEDESEI